MTLTSSYRTSVGAEDRAILVMSVDHDFNASMIGAYLWAIESNGNPFCAHIVNVVLDLGQKIVR